MAGTPDKMALSRAALQEFDARGQRATDFFAEDVVFDFSEFQGWIEEREYVGIEAFNAQMDRWTEPFESWAFVIDELIDLGGNDVLGVGVQRGLMKGSGAAVEMPAGQIWTIRNGKLVWIRMFANAEDAYAAAGVQPPSG